MTKQTELLVVQDLETIEHLINQINRDGEQFFDVMLQVIKSYDQDFDVHGFADISYSFIFGLLEHCADVMKKLREKIEEETNESAN